MIAPRGLEQPVPDGMAAIKPPHQRLKRRLLFAHYLGLRRRCRQLGLPASPGRKEARFQVERPVDRLEHLDPAADPDQRAIALEQDREGRIVHRHASQRDYCHIRISTRAVIGRRVCCANLATASAAESGL